MAIAATRFAAPGSPSMPRTRSSSATIAARAGSRGSSSGSSASATAMGLQRVLHELPRHLAAGDDVHEADERNLHDASRNRVLDLAGAIGHDQRTDGHRRLERRRAALAHRGVGGAQQRERRRVHERIGTALLGNRDVRRRAHDHLQRGIAPLQLTRRRDERIEMARDLLRAAAGKEREQRRPADADRARAARRDRAASRAVEQRMPDEGRVDAVVAEQLLLERQNHRGLRHRARQRLHAAGARRPHLRRDVVQHRHARLGGDLGDLHVEAAVVDEHDERDVAALHARAKLVASAEILRQALERLDEAHDRELLDVLDELDAGVAHPVAADAGERERRARARELARYPAAC